MFFFHGDLFNLCDDLSASNDLSEATSTTKVGLQTASLLFVCLKGTVPTFKCSQLNLWLVFRLGSGL